MENGVRPCTDAMQNARQRMRHLARWNIEPVPMVGQSSHPAAGEALSDEARQRLARLSLQVLAVQMRNAAPTSSLARR